MVDTFLNIVLAAVGVILLIGKGCLMVRHTVEWIQSGCRFPPYIHAVALSVLLIGGLVLWTLNIFQSVRTVEIVMFLVGFPLIAYIAFIVYGGARSQPNDDNRSADDALRSSHERKR